MSRVFNGTSDKVDANGATVFNTTTGQVACSFSAWVNGVLSAGTIFAEGGANTQAWSFLCGTSPNQARMRVLIENDGGTPKIDVTGTLTAFEAAVWHHICWTQDAANPINYTSYVDGVVDLNASFVAGTGFVNPPARTSFGYLHRSGSGNFFAGRIAEVATWSRTLSATEVAALASGTYASNLAPDYYWPLAGIASPEPDIGTAAEIDGAVTGTTTAPGPPKIGQPTFIPSLGRRPVPMIQGPDKDRLLGMRGNSF